MIAALLCAALPIAFVVGVWWGRSVERRTLWERMTRDRRFGHEVLERLAERHGAKLELYEP